MSLTSVIGVAGSRRRTPLRTTQIEDEWWVPAQRIAAIRGESLAAVMKEAVKRYVRRHRHLLDEDSGADHTAL